MNRFLRTMALILIGAFSGVLGAAYYFNLPINFNPITVFNIGSGDVDIDNDGKDKEQPAPTPSPAAPPKTPESKPTPTPLAETQTGEGNTVIREPVTTPQSQSSGQSETVARNYKQRQHPRSAFADWSQPSSRRDSCENVPAISVEMPDEDSVQYSAPRRAIPPGQVLVRRRLIVNGRVVSDRTTIEPDSDDDY